MAELIFYTNPMSRGQIARWMLHEVDADYEQRILGYDESMKSQEYRAINPMGKVPAIEHKGKVVTECAAICAYLADVYPDKGLAPVNGEHADYYRWLFFAAGPLEQAITNRSMDFVPNEHQQRMAGYGSYGLVVDVLDAKLAESPYICGERFTAADVYVGAHVTWGIAFGSLPDRDNFKNYMARVENRPAYGAAKQIDEQLIATIQQQD